MIFLRHDIVDSGIHFSVPYPPRSRMHTSLYQYLWRSLYAPLVMHHARVLTMLPVDLLVQIFCHKKIKRSVYVYCLCCRNLMKERVSPNDAPAIQHEVSRNN